MADTIKVTYKVNEDGSLGKIAKGAEKAAKSTDKATKASGRFNKGAKGVAGATSNSTKAFSKMRSEMGGSSGLVAAYATFAANVFALTAAFGALQRAAQLQKLEEGFGRLANAVGRTSSLMASSIQDLTNNAISFDQAMRTAATGFSAGFSTDELEGLTKVARGAATALGRDLPDALDRLVRGTAKLEPEILDELGIFIKIDDAVRKYADTLGKSATSLTQTQRRQAFLNETLAQGARKFGGIADQVDVNPYDRLAANFDKLSKSALNLFSNVLSPVIGFLANNTLALLGTLILFGSSLTKTMFPVLTKLGTKFEVASAKASEAAKKALADQKTLNKVNLGAFKADKGVGKNTTFGKLQQRALKGEKLGIKDLQKAKESLLRSEMVRASKLETMEGDRKKRAVAALADIKQQRLAVEGLMDSQRGLGQAQMQAKTASAASTAESGVGASIVSIGGGSAREGFASASKGFKDYKAELPQIMKAQEGLNKKTGFFAKLMSPFPKQMKLASAGIRLFGAAFVNAIPVIGQIIFAIGLLIQGFTSLFKAITKPTKAQAQMTQVTETLNEKLTQLTDTNATLVSKYQELELSQIIKDQKELTIDVLAGVYATAEINAEIESYANNLAVTAGVMKEFSSALISMNKELNARSQEGGVLDFIAFEMEKALNSTMGLFRDLLGVIKSIPQAIVSAYSALGSGVSSLVGGFYDGIGFLETTFLGTTVISDTKTKVVEGAKDIAKGVSDAISEAGAQAVFDKKILDFSSNVIENFSGLSEQLTKAGLGDKLKIAFNEGSLEDYIQAQLKTIDTTASLVEQNKALVIVMGNITTKVAAVAVGLQQDSDAINKFGVNVTDAASSLRKFALAAKDKNPYTDLGENVETVSNAIAELKRVSEPSGSLSFANLLASQVAQGNIKLEEYGVTQDEVVAAVNAGKEPFEALTATVADASKEYLEGKAAIKELKTELQQFMQVTANKKALDAFNESLKTLKSTGTFEVTGLQALNNQQSNFKERIAAIIQEKDIKDAIAEREMVMAHLKLDMLVHQNSGNEKILANLELQRNALEGQLAATKEMNKLKADGQTVAANSDFYKNQDSRQSKSLSAAGEGDTTFERMQNFQESGGFAGLDTVDKDTGERMKHENGNDVTNIGGKMAAVTAQMSPMIDSLKQLGPEGELVAAITAGTLAMGEAFGSLADKMAAGTATTADKLAAAGAAIGAIGGMMAASSKAKIAGIDQEIEAEKKRDGKSQASIAKIAAMEKKKEALKRKAFEQDKKMKMAQTVISTASAIMQAMAHSDPVTGAIMAAMVGAMGAAQLGVISGMTYQGGGTGAGAGGGVTSIAVGQRKSSIDTAKSQSAGGELSYLRGDSGMGGPENFRPTPAFSGYKNRAAGGFVVGEQGPEVFMPEVAGDIIPAGQNMGSNTNVNFSINAVDADGVEDLLVRQRGNIIGMMREAANSYGQDFMEGIDTSVYTPSSAGARRY